MQQDPKVTKILADYAEAKLIKSTYEDHFQQLRRWCRPNTPDFRSSGPDLKGQRKHDEIYDSTAPWALEQFASGLSSVLTDMSTRWFGLGLQGIPMKELSREELLYLEDVSDRIYYEFALPDSRTYQTLHENYQDIGAFGTTVQFQFWNTKDNHMQFRACPLADCFLMENEMDEVDKIFYRRTFSTRQLLAQWPHLAEMANLNIDFDKNRDWEIVHAVFPRTERKVGSLLSKNKPFAAFYVSPDIPVPLEESGFDHFPYNIGRWTKEAGEIYGRSPGMSVLPDILTVNQMQKELLVSAQLANFPPIVMEEESLLVPMEGQDGGHATLVPKSLLWIEQGSQFPQALNSGMQPQLSLEMLEGLRESITRAFFVNHLIREQKKERQTTTEILDERGQMMRQLQPNFGRVNADLIDNMIKTAYFHLDSRNEFPEPPSSLSGQKLEIIYYSPAAKAQLGTKAQNISGFLQDITPLINVAPDMANEIDWSEVLTEYAHARDIPQKVIKDPAVRQAEKEQQAQAAQQQQQMEQAPGMAKAVKDIADAREKDPSLIPSLS